MELRDADKLILLMLSEIYEKLGIKNQEVDPEFIKHVIFIDHSWAFDWAMPGLNLAKKDDPTEVGQVVDILDMWGFLEDSIERLSPGERAKVEKTSDGHHRITQFPGFDGNHETEYMSIAQTFIEHLGRFERFASRDLNAHRATVPKALRMVQVFEPIRAKIGDRLHRGEIMTASEIIQVLDA